VFDRYPIVSQERSIKELLLLRLSGVIAIALVPFAYLRMLESQWTMAYVDLGIVCIMSLLFLFVYVSRRVRTAGVFLALGFVSAALMTTLLLGVSHVFWAYPALIVAFFMLDTRHAMILGVGFVVCFLGVLSKDLPLLNLATVSLTLVVTILLANAFSLTSRRQQSALRDMASVDPLTGVGNRRAQNQKIDSVTAIYRRSCSPASLLILDIDYFKKINDLHGHVMGDQVLVEIADHIRKCTRATETLYRYGGEEFVVVAEQTGLDAAVILAEKLRDTIEQRTFTCGIKLTVSIGVSQLQNSEGRQSWLGRADGALFQAKGKGRNQVVLAEMPLRGIYLASVSEQGN
jgi:diguanylate cyclase (GGDEF)-like protein